MNYVLIRSLLSMGLLAFSFVPATYGCQCAGEQTPSEAQQDAAAVFAGTVIDLNGDGNFVKVRVHVTERFKGVSKDSSDVEVQTDYGGPACGFLFLTGQSYLIYGGPGLRVNHCSRTKRLDRASEDLKFLHSMKIELGASLLFQKQPIKV